MRHAEFIRSRLPENIEGRALAWYVVVVFALLALLAWGLAKLAPPPHNLRKWTRSRTG